MKAIKLCAAVFLSSLLFVSCAEEGESNAKSNSVDSSNVHGTAPVEYGPDDPKDNTPALDPRDDTGRRENTTMENEKEVR